MLSAKIKLNEMYWQIHHNKKYRQNQIYFSFIKFSANIQVFLFKVIDESCS